MSAHACDADDDGGEDDGRERHADELDEAVAERLERDGEVREETADDDAEHDADQDLQPERAERWGGTAAVCFELGCATAMITPRVGA